MELLSPYNSRSGCSRCEYFGRRFLSFERDGFSGGWRSPWGCHNRRYRQGWQGEGCPCRMSGTFCRACGGHGEAGHRLAFGWVEDGNVHRAGCGGHSRYKDNPGHGVAPRRTWCNRLPARMGDNGRNSESRSQVYLDYAESCRTKPMTIGKCRDSVREPRQWWGQMWW